MFKGNDKKVLRKEQVKEKLNKLGITKERRCSICSSNDLRFGFLHHDGGFVETNIADFISLYSSNTTRLFSIHCAECGKVAISFTNSKKTSFETVSELFEVPGMY
ncbi:TPA: hypothetical protein ACSZA9_14405 [Listeria monocytogenes]|nr:hypothetical protein [Listeria monocytogenes]EAH3957139.1 hypothetical protein [Listeria monocytogenes]EKA2552501.1 hypothetical protein [Listeria monocytogenes]EKA2555635.1 hypothetical protein [Listeria monocytogenes]EKA2558779.1 hypothetical protein [Listeria monocytogenes]